VSLRVRTPGTTAAGDQGTANKSNENRPRRVWGIRKDLRGDGPLPCARRTTSNSNQFALCQGEGGGAIEPM
jgi:hypothetical protein